MIRILAILMWLILNLKPYMDHNLITKPHWGLVVSSDFGFSNFLRPMDEDLLTHFSSSRR